MYKRTIFTTITPLPSYITRETVVATLHNHSEMIELNPLVIHHEPCRPPPSAPADEYHCVWYQITDRISYLPGGLMQGKVNYKGCFYDLPRGLQTHVYAPTGLDIRDKWRVCGNMPGEPREPIELGLPDAPREGLYLREDVDMRCQIWATSFVKKTLKKAHSMLVDRLVMKADMLKEQAQQVKQDGSSPARAELDCRSEWQKSSWTRIELPGSSVVHTRPHSAWHPYAQMNEYKLTETGVAAPTDAQRINDGRPHELE
ncbi:hypothetical protein PHISCL_08135 [Aspergillus sclerotialis]|uniref:DUF7053 domain-containing protein n=1 Tax=Aspergillus sclerotialis TaxID=2070753 RepID=A0A3A2ZA93_9EURO|nr:hypothetical protein PHISCL_08135 [Aspergillus sclerotialis]